MPIGVAIAAGATVVLKMVSSQQLDLDNFGFLLAMGFCVAVVIFALGGLDTSRWEPRSMDQGTHPDPDVEALLQKRIDVAEYARRKDAEKALESQSSASGSEGT